MIVHFLGPERAHSLLQPCCTIKSVQPEGLSAGHMTQRLREKEEEGGGEGDGRRRESGGK